MVAHSLGVNLDKRNRGTCPVHGGDNRTAFSIDEKNNRWSCFSHGCHEGHSDMIGLTMLIRRCSFIEAVNFIASIAGVDLSGDHSEEITKALITKDTRDFIHRSDVYNIDTELSTRLEEEVYYMRQSRTDFFLNKGYTSAILDYFEVGHTTDKFGIPRESFPLRDKQGRVVAIDGRRVDGDIEPRYFVQPDGFNKGHILYHYHRAKDYVPVFNGVLFVVEGYKACWSMVQAGLVNVVAAMGAGLSSEQPKLILENIQVEKVVLVFDGDEAGRNGTVRNKRDLGHLCSIESVYMPDGQDPSTLDPQALRELLNPYVK